MKRILKIIVIAVILFYFIGNILPNLIGVPLAAYDSYKIMNEAKSLIKEQNQKKITTTNQDYFKNSIWIHEKDSLARIEIKKGKWIFYYKGTNLDSTDIYDYKLTNFLPEFEDFKSKSNEFLILTNNFDTLKYELLNYNEEYLSLMYLPNGQFHTYKSKK